MKINELAMRTAKLDCLVELTYRLEQDVAATCRDVESLDARMSR